MPQSSAHFPLRRRFEHACRDTLLRVMRVIFKSPSVQPSAGEPLSKILIVRTSHNLGDVVMASAVVDECRALFPRSTIALLANERLVGLFRHHDTLDRVFDCHHRWFLRPLHTVRTLRAIRREKFDLAIDCANLGAPSLNNWLLTRLTNARYRVGFANQRGDGSDTFLNVLVDAPNNEHFITSQLRLLSPFAEPTTFRQPRLALTAEEISVAGKLAGDSPTRPRVIMFIPEARPKAWRLEIFLKLAEALAQNKIAVLLCFGPTDARRNGETVREFSARFPDRVRVMPPLKVREFAALISQSDLFISNDCGPMHLAVAAGAPTVSAFLFGNDTMHGYHDGKRHFVVKEATDEKRLAKTVETAKKFLSEM